MKERNINNFKKHKAPDLRDLLDNRLLQLTYRTSVGIMQTIYRMACVVMVATLLFGALGLALSWFSP